MRQIARFGAVAVSRRHISVDLSFVQDCIQLCARAAMHPVATKMARGRQETHKEQAKTRAGSRRRAGVKLSFHLRIVGREAEASMHAQAARRLRVPAAMTIGLGQVGKFE